MNRDAFVKYIKNPQSLDSKSINEVNELINTYPYFQTAHLLCVKNLYNINSKNQELQLKVSSVFVHNREKLLELLEDKLKQNVETKREKKEDIIKKVEEKKDVDKNTLKKEENKKEKITKEETVELTKKREEPEKKEEEKPIEDIGQQTTSMPEKKEQQAVPKEKEEIEEYIQTVSSNNKEELKNIITQRVQELSGDKKEIEKEEQTVPKSAGVADKVLETIKKIKEEQAKKKGGDSDSSSKEDQIEVNVENKPEKELKEDNKAPSSDILEIDNSENIEIIEEKKEEISFSSKSTDLLEFDEEAEKPKTENDSKKKNYGTVGSSGLLEYERKEDINEHINFEIEEDDIIGSFIKSNPRIDPNKMKEDNSAPKEIIDEGVQESEELYTEALAKIQVAQGNYSKAIEIYEKLSLKYPEKNSYFAGQIQKIKDNIK